MLHRNRVFHSALTMGQGRSYGISSSLHLLPKRTEGQTVDQNQEGGFSHFVSQLDLPRPGRLSASTFTSAIRRCTGRGLDSEVDPPALMVKSFIASILAGDCACFGNCRQSWPELAAFPVLNFLCSFKV